MAGYGEGECMSMGESAGRIAIVGMAGRFPGALSVERFWRNLVEGRDCTTVFTDEQVRESGVPENLLTNPAYVKRGAPIDEVDCFDARFFGYAPRDAELLDPQFRIFLETAYDALANAGCDPDRFDGAIGVYAGCGFNNYLLKTLLPAAQRYEDFVGFQTIISNDKDYLVSRVNYKLNLRGPGVVVQSACSTSLVAVSLACQALLTYQCDMALAGGVSLQVPRSKGYLYRDGEIFAPDGICRPFDANAKGTILGEGVALVTLKRLDDALTDNDTIYAVIRGTAINNDGSVRIGYTAPSVQGQAEVIAAAQAMADVNPDDIGYVEAHGTGTLLGDPIEVAALAQAFASTGSGRRGYCGLGSVKSNIGHLDVAAGVTGLIKVALSLYHGKLPPTLHFTSPNPEIKLEQTPFYIVDKLREWPQSNKARIGCVSSFGIGGTNAHVILEEAPVLKIVQPGADRHVFVLSSKTPEALQRMSANLAEHLEAHPDIDMADVAYTLAAGRSHFEHRAVTVCNGKDDAVRLLRQPDQARCGSLVCSTESRPVVLLFSGQGTQYPGMCKGLYESETVFRGVVDRCAQAALGILKRDLRELLLKEMADERTEAEINQTAVAQPALFAVECGLAQLWRERGIVPTALVGHSIGELAAACEAGVFTLDDGARIAAIRGSLMQSMPTGTMVAVPLGPLELEQFLNPDCVIAVVNGPSISVVSGPTEAIDRFESTLDAKGIKCRRLHTSHAFHSPMMDGAVDKFVEEIGSFKLSAPTIPFTSNVSGGWITAEEATDARYWGRQLRSTVLFCTMPA
jgi:acyl transferase domain-containing protein